VVAVLALAIAGPTGTAVASAHGSPPTPWPGGIWQPEAATYGMTVVSNVPVTMDDGVILFATIG
jgi:hypothetical protein